MRSLMTHLILLQHHEIKMLDPLGCVVPHALLERRIANDITDVLVDESIPEALLATAV